MSLWPRKVEIQDVLTNSLWWLIAGFMGSFIILSIVFFTSWVISLDVASEFNHARMGAVDTNSMFPFVLSFITFLATTVSTISIYFILNITNPERYKRNLVVLWQIWFFGILTYVFATPVYIVMWLQDYDYIMIIFIVHCILLSFGTSLILEILNNYRYILTSVYGSFIGLFLSIFISLAIFYYVPSWTAKLISLLVILPTINTSMILFKWLFEFWYYHYNKYTNLDQLGDIFYQIELESKEKVRDEVEKNSL